MPKRTWAVKNNNCKKSVYNRSKLHYSNTR